MFTVGITDYGSPQIVAKHMFQSGENAGDLTEIMTAIALDMMRVTYINFTSEGRRGGGSWKHLAPSTILKKGHSAILVDTEDLINSVTYPDAEYQILHIERDGIIFGTDRPWAFVHQYGSDRVPARPFLRYLDYDVARWREMIAGDIVKPFFEGTGAPG